VTWHPLAGTSYRPDVLRGLRAQILDFRAERVVIVGHSQGSVLAAGVAGGKFEASAPATGDPVLGHGDYWTSPRQVRQVNAEVGQPRAPAG
jgi:hypothetical protein